jgi:RNA-binding protein Tab2/Atab2
MLLVDRLPDVLKAESYAFVALPAEAFWDGQVNSENIKKGRLCPIRDLPKTGWIHGITLFSKVRLTVSHCIILVPYSSPLY